MARLAYQIRYRDGDGQRKWLTIGKYTKHRFDDYQAALDHVILLTPGWRHKYDPRVVAVRVKPRARLSEAEIRKAERERVAAAFEERGRAVLFNDSTVAEVSGLSRFEIGAKVIQRAILAFDWKPGAP